MRLVATLFVFAFTVLSEPGFAARSCIGVTNYLLVGPVQPIEIDKKAVFELGVQFNLAEDVPRTTESDLLLTVDTQGALHIARVASIEFNPLKIRTIDLKTRAEFVFTDTSTFRVAQGLKPEMIPYASTGDPLFTTVGPSNKVVQIPDALVLIALNGEQIAAYKNAQHMWQLTHDIFVPQNFSDLVINPAAGGTPMDVIAVSPDLRRLVALRVENNKSEIKIIESKTKVVDDVWARVTKVSLGDAPTDTLKVGDTFYNDQGHLLTIGRIYKNKAGQVQVMAYKLGSSEGQWLNQNQIFLDAWIESRRLVLKANRPGNLNAEATLEVIGQNRAGAYLVKKSDHSVEVLMRDWLEKHYEGLKPDFEFDVPGESTRIAFPSSVFTGNSPSIKAGDPVILFQKNNGRSKPEYLVLDAVVQKIEGGSGDSAQTVLHAQTEDGALVRVQLSSNVDAAAIVRPLQKSDHFFCFPLIYNPKTAELYRAKGQFLDGRYLLETVKHKPGKATGSLSVHELHADSDLKFAFFEETQRLSYAESTVSIHQTIWFQELDARGQGRVGSLSPATILAIGKFGDGGALFVQPKDSDRIVAINFSTIDKLFGKILTAPKQ